MARPLAPFWLTTPSRFATLKRPAACWALALLIILLAVSLASPAPSPVSHGPVHHADDETDVVLYESIVAGVRGGGEYYAVTAQALRIGNYPLKPFVTFRLPTLALLQAALPHEVTIALLYALAAGVTLAWFVRLRPALARPPPILLALGLLAGGMVVFVQPELANFHEIWAGLLIALSLALRRPERWIEAVAVGMMAMLIRETAALYVGIMAMLALAGGHRREALGWFATIAVFAVV
ncbi:MAG: hypothetical protein ABI810_12200, partial [Sphingomonas bacterium]